MSNIPLPPPTSTPPPFYKNRALLAFIILAVSLIIIFVVNTLSTPMTTIYTALPLIGAYIGDIIYNSVQSYTALISNQTTNATGYPIAVSSPILHKGPRKVKWSLIRWALVGAIGIFLLSYAGIVYPSYTTDICTPYSILKVNSVLQDKFFPSAIHATQVGNECIGISDGSFKLGSSGFADALTMSQAAQLARDGNLSDANSGWDQARGQAIQDAEPLIYSQNPQITGDTSQKYFDIVVVTMLSGNQASISIGQNELRGFAIAQNDYNSQHTSGIPIRFLIANVGSDSNHADLVEQQIKQLANDDPHFVGILGWPASISPKITNVIQDLGQTRIPIISPTMTADQLSQLSAYFFRMVPPNKKQAEVQVGLVKTAFHNAHPTDQDTQPIRVAILTTANSPNGQSLSQDFEDYVNTTSQGMIDILFNKTYDRLQASQINSLVDRAVTQKADIIYLSGNSDEAKIVLDRLASMYPTNPIKVVGGDALDHIKDYPYADYPPAAFNRLYYTSFKAPPKNCQSAGGFFQHYYETFKLCPDTSAMLAFDTANTMFQAMTQVMTSSNLTRDNLWQALKSINDLHPFKGITGHISFDNGDRSDPIIHLFFVDDQGIIQQLT